MADISMCTDKMCPLYHRCYRAQAKPNEYRQSYYPYKWNYGCHDYIPMEKEWLDRQGLKPDAEVDGLKHSS